MASREPGGAERRLHRIVQAVSTRPPSPSPIPSAFFQHNHSQKLTGACDGRQQSIAGERRGPQSRTAGGACTLPQEEGTAGAAATRGAIQEPAHHRQQAAEGRGEVCQDRDASHCAVMATQLCVIHSAHSFTAQPSLLLSPAAAAPPPPPPAFFPPASATSRDCATR